MQSTKVPPCSSETDALTLTNWWQSSLEQYGVQYLAKRTPQHVVRLADTLLQIYKGSTRAMIKANNPLPLLCVFKWLRGLSLVIFSFFWVKILYTVLKPQPKWKDKVCFHLFNGTGQGCPLSPHLFDVTIKHLATVLREPTSLAGVQKEGLYY